MLPSSNITISTGSRISYVVFITENIVPDLAELNINIAIYKEIKVTIVLTGTVIIAYSPVEPVSEIMFISCGVGVCRI